MRLIDADALKKKIEEVQYTQEFCIEHQIDYSISMQMLGMVIDNAPIVGPQIEYGVGGQLYELSMSGGQVVPDLLQGWRYEERPQGEWIMKNDYTFDCNLCGCSCLDKNNYCPDCGADMRG